MFPAHGCCINIVRPGCQHRERPVVLEGQCCQKMGGEQWNILTAFAQRRDMNTNYVDTEEQVLPELAFRNQLCQIAVGCRDQADVYRSGGSCS